MNLQKKIMLIFTKLLLISSLITKSLAKRKSLIFERKIRENDKKGKIGSKTIIS
jgi:hypothetical protein